jgi:hypothetical protein
MLRAWPTYSLMTSSGYVRSVAMAPPGAPSGLGREMALAVLSQLLEVTENRDNLIAELVAAGLA